MKATLLEILTSKKAIAAAVSAIVWGLGRLHYNADPSAMLGLVTPIWLYIVGQALADHGKSAALINAAAFAVAQAPAAKAPAAKAETP